MKCVYNLALHIVRFLRHPQEVQKPSFLPEAVPGVWSIHSPRPGPSPACFKTDARGHPGGISSLRVHEPGQRAGQMAEMGWPVCCLCAKLSVPLRGGRTPLVLCSSWLRGRGICSPWSPHWTHSGGPELLQAAPLFRQQRPGLGSQEAAGPSVSQGSG